VDTLAACGDAEQNALDPAGPFAQAPQDLIIPVAWIALAVFIFVQGLIIFSVIKFRTRKDDDGVAAQAGPRQHPR
jgi:cytochrome c oxidase subunit II